MILAFYTCVGLQFACIALYYHGDPHPCTRIHATLITTRTHQSHGRKMNRLMLKKVLVPVKVSHEGVKHCFISIKVEEDRWNRMIIFQVPVPPVFHIATPSTQHHKPILQ